MSGPVRNRIFQVLKGVGDLGLVTNGSNNFGSRFAEGVPGASNRAFGESLLIANTSESHHSYLVRNHTRDTSPPPFPYRGMALSARDSRQIDILLHYLVDTPKSVPFNDSFNSFRTREVLDLELGSDTIPSYHRTSDKCWCFKHPF